MPQPALKGLQGPNLITVQGRVVRKPISANPGLKVNRGIYFLYIKEFSIDCVLRSLGFFKLKPEWKTI